MEYNRQPKNQYQRWTKSPPPYEDIIKVAQVWGYAPAYQIAIYLSVWMGFDVYLLAADGRLLHKIPGEKFDRA